jgi:acetylornithine deacetylase/succinyl-diaminopimelate desuccinylase-like protein
MGAPDSVLRALDDDFEHILEDLKELVRIPGISAAGFDPTELERSAQAVAELLRDAGLEKVEVLRLGGAHPYAVGEWLGAGPAVPTILLYAHHDVQPPGRIELWESPAFEPTLHPDGRLYGRGVVDDKAGILVHIAAIRAWLEEEGALPVNLKVVVEGEEEIGSVHLSAFLRTHRERLAADAIVLSDTANLATGLPSITTSLRGLVSVDLTVRALDHSLHSGIWGGPVPDAATALGVILGRLLDERGQVAIPGLCDDVPALSPQERARMAVLPFDEGAFRKDAGMLDCSRFAGDDACSVYERLWMRPAVAVTALEAVPLAEAANQLIAEARARVGVRLAPDQSEQRARDLVVAFLERDPPWGVEVSTRVEAALPGWRTQAEGPAFDAARRALSFGFGRQPVLIGCGGSIPFVGPFTEVLGGVPALLLGLEDPACNAHGENESLDLGDLRKATRATAHLLDELRTLRPRG